MTPDIQAASLHRVDKQRFARQIFRLNARFVCQRMIRGQHQTHLIIKHRRIVQTTARQDVGS